MYTYYGCQFSGTGCYSARKIIIREAPIWVPSQSRRDMTYTPSSSLSEDYAPWLSRQIATLERERKKHEQRLGYRERRICIPLSSRGSLCGSQENVAETAGSICHDLKLSADDPDSNQRIIKACERIKSGDLPDFYDISCFKKTAEQAARECIFFFLRRWDFLGGFIFFHFPTNYVIFPSAWAETLHHVVCPHIIPFLLL